MCKKLIAIILCIVTAFAPFVTELAPFAGGIVFASDGYSPVCENRNFAMYLNRSENGFKVVDKSNGYIWSNISQEPRYERMSRDWQSFAESLAVIEYISETGAVIRSMIDKSNENSAEYETLTDGFAVTLNFTDAKIKLRMLVRLTESGITAELPDDSIVYDGFNILGKVIVMPFLGASYADEIPGYIFVPDGCGALIQFAPPREYSSSYVGRIYGNDYSVSGAVTQRSSSALDVSMQQVYFPVFGIAHGNKENAFIAVMQSGEEFCEIEASPAGNILDYFWAAPKFIYHELYWQPSGGGRGFNTPNTDRNVVNAKVSYDFLSGENADYVGMANRYKQILIEKGVLSKKESGGSVPIKLDALMAEQEKSLLGSSSLVMTRTQDVSRWLEALNGNGIENLVVSLLGMEKGGISGHKLGTFSIEGKAGGENGLKKLHEDAKAKGVVLTMQSDYMSGYEHQLSAGNSIHGISGAYVTEEITKPLFSKKRFSSAANLLSIANQTAKQKEYKKNLSLDAIGNTILSDYRRSNAIYREQAREAMETVLETFSRNTVALLLESPNEYALRYVDMVYNAPDTNSMQLYETEAVPFYQIVLSGYVDMFSPYLNYRSNSIGDILKLIDYNMGPSYLLTEKYSSELSKTNIVDVYSSRYEDWEPLILSQYNKINDVLRNVRGQEIVSRTVTQENIAVITYSGGGSVVVNYSEEAYTYKGVVVGALSGMFVKGE